MKGALLAFVLLLATVPATAAELSVTIPFDASGVQLREVGPYTAVYAEGTLPINTVGMPAVPAMTVRVALPTGCSASDLTVTDVSWTPIRGRFTLIPATEQVPLSLMETVEIPAPEPDPDVYSSSDFFPGRVVRLNNSSAILGIPVAWLTVYPVRWNPLSGTIEVLESVTVSLDCRDDPSVRLVQRRSYQSEARSMEAVARSVVNPDGVSPSGALLVDSRDLAYGEYVIIATSAYQSYAQELADWKTRKGIPASVYTTTWIQSQYSCADLQQEMRAFLTDCRDEGCEYVLIYGDDDVIPGRDVKISYGSTEYPPVDLYFEDINDTAPGADLWDSNGNGVWGEYGIDQVDYHPDFWTGRASVNSTGEAQIFNNKVFIYEDIMSLDYFETAPRELRIGYTTGMLWPGCYGSAGAELISAWLPSSSWEEEKCYESLGNNNSTITRNMINAGPHHVYHASHGNQTSMNTSNGSSYTVAHIMAQTNISSGHLPAIWNSIACLIGQIDGYECCGDAWLNSPNGGGFGAFNARYGWGNPSSPGWGVSEVLSRNFYDAHWNDGHIRLGEAHAMGNDMMSPPGDACEDWCVKEYNLLGEPEIMLWTAPAADMNVSHPSTVSGATTVTVTVSTAKAPISGALVCLQKGNWQTGEVYEVGTTNASGQVQLYVNPTTGGSILVTVSAHNYTPYMGTIAVSGTGVGGSVGGIHVNSVDQAFPSPASEIATIPFSIEAAAHTSVQVFDIAGRVVATLADGDMAAGNHSLTWDLTDGNGARVPSGIYHLRVVSGDYTGSTNLVVIR